MPNLSLTPIQRRAARALALGHSQRVTARKVGCDERTVRRWLSDVPGFREEVAEYRESLTDTQPLDVLHELLNSTDDRVRLSAAQTLVRLPSDDEDEGDDEEAAALAAWK
jgi:HEAT repeat protein